VRTIYPRNTVVSQQLHTVPPYIVGAFFTVLIPFISWRIDRRTILFICSAPLMMIGYIMVRRSQTTYRLYFYTYTHNTTQFLASHNPQVRYGATFLIASGAFSFGALCNAHASANVVSDTARASAIGTVVMFGNVGGLISTWSFLPFDGPNYRIGNGLNLATSSTVLILSIALLFWMKRSNTKREGVNVDQELAGKSVGEIEDMDWRHPSFRWRP
jgi:hypothetical protein